MVPETEGKDTSTKDIEDKTRRRTIIPRSNNHTITNNHQQLSFVVALCLSQRVVSSPANSKRSIAYRITRVLTNDKFVMVFRRLEQSEYWINEYP